jgi:hypothetical protein
MTRTFILRISHTSTDACGSSNFVNFVIRKIKVKLSSFSWRRNWTVSWRSERVRETRKVWRMVILIRSSLLNFKQLLSCPSLTSATYLDLPPDFRLLGSKNKKYSTVAPHWEQCPNGTEQARRLYNKPKQESVRENWFVELLWTRLLRECAQIYISDIFHVLDNVLTWNINIFLYCWLCAKSEVKI